MGIDFSIPRPNMARNDFLYGPSERLYFDSREWICVNCEQARRCLMIESMLSVGFIQATCFPEGVLGTACVYWHWAFWAGVILGFVGLVAGFLMKSDPSK